MTGQRIAQTVTIAIGVSFLLVVVGMFTVGRTSPGGPADLIGPTTADAAMRRLTTGDVRARSRVEMHRWCRSKNIVARVPIAPGVGRRSRVSKCLSSRLTRRSCWVDTGSRRGECAVEIRFDIYAPWHGQIGWDFPITHWCFDSILVWQRLQTGILDSKREGDEECHAEPLEDVKA